MSPKQRRTIWLLVRLTVCVGLLWLVFHKFDWGQAGEIIRQLDRGGALLALAVFLPAPVLQSIRFVWMLRLQDIRISYWMGIKLCFTGNLLNFIVLGAIGGDLYKAYYVARGTDRKPEAVTTIFLDRVVGLTSLVFLTAVVTLINYRDPLIGQLTVVGPLKLGPALVLGLAAMVLGAILYFSPTLRSVTRAGRLVDRLSIGNVIRRADEAAHIIRRRPAGLAACFAITFVLQFTAIVSAYLGARALGMITDSFIPYLVYIPLGFLVWAVPISFGGLGTMDAYYEWIIVACALGSAEQAIFLAWFARLTQLIWSLPGILVLLTGAHLPSAEEVAGLQKSASPAS